MNRICLLVFSAALSAYSRTGGAQAVAGTVTDEEFQRAVANVIIRLEDTDGRTVTAALTDDAGRFHLRSSAPGTFLLRAERVGFQSSLSAPFELASNETINRDFSISARVVSLSEIRIHSKQICPGELDGTAAASQWEELRKVLLATSLNQSTQGSKVTLVRFTRTYGKDGRTVLHATSSKKEVVTAIPFKSISAELLAENGFVQRDRDAYVFHAPDADVLLADAFLGSHCLSEAKSRSPDGDFIGLRFSPVARRKVPDVQGTFWMQRGTMALSHIDFSYVGLPAEISSDRLGGIIKFGQTPQGRWIVTSWTIRTPVRAVSPTSGYGRAIRLSSSGELRIIGFKEEGADVLQFENSSSVASGPSVSGLATGITAVAVPESLENIHSELTTPATVRTESPCLKRQPAVGRLYGIAGTLNYESMAGSARVEATWTAWAGRDGDKSVSVGQGSILTSTTLSMEAIPDSAGRFNLCDVPLGVKIRIRAVSDSVTSFWESVQLTTTSPERVVEFRWPGRKSGGSSDLEGSDLETAQQSNVYDLLLAHRPAWLRKRGRVSVMREESIRVYVDGLPQGGLEVLRGMNARGITSIKFLSASEATQRFGTGNPSGAIVIVTSVAH